MTLCGIVVQKGQMTEARPCIRDGSKGHSHHSPDLSNMVFGNLTVKRLAQPHRKSDGCFRTRWICEQDGIERAVFADGLIYGCTKGLRNMHGLSRRDGKPAPEYKSVKEHYLIIFDTKGRYPTYQGMPFCEDWNPQKGGAYWKGAKWIINNLGQKPGPSWSLDIIEHERGFVPGNLRWALKKSQTRNQQHRILGRFSLEELRIEAKRHGFILVPEIESSS
jgi:hypothetical protein